MQAVGASQLERDTFLLRRYSAVEDIEAARNRSLDQLWICMAKLNSQRRTLYEQLANHEVALAGSSATGDPADHCEEKTIAVPKAELENLDEAVARRHPGIAPAIERT